MKRPRMISCVPVVALPGVLRTARATQRLSVRQAAKLARVSPSTFSRVENRGPCTAKVYVRLSAWGVRHLPWAS